MEITHLPDLKGKNFRYYSSDHDEPIFYGIINRIQLYMHESIDSNIIFCYYIIDNEGDYYSLDECTISMEDDLSDLYSKAVLRQNKSI